MLQKLRNEYNENTTVNADAILPTTQTQYERKCAPKNRLLTVILTDGTHTIKAIEITTIESFNEDMKPGTKVLI